MTRCDYFWEITTIQQYRDNINIAVYLKPKESGNNATGFVSLQKDKLPKAIELKKQNRLVSIEEIEQL